jgi:hypothetical protein
MKIQFNTDKTISGDENQEDYFTSLIAEKLNRFQPHITRSAFIRRKWKRRTNDIQCILEGIEARDPIAVTVTPIPKKCRVRCHRK